MQPLISVIIVAGLKRKKELLYCLKTIYLSNYKNFEVILVDNSTDPEVAEIVNKQFPKTKVIAMPSNTGIFGYNVGFANAKGKYVLTLDDDCSIPKDTLSNIEKSFKKKSNNVAVLVANVYNPISKEWVTKYYNDQNKTEIYTFAGACVYRKEVLDKVGYYDADFFCWFHEPDLAFRIQDKGYKINYEKNVVIYHHQKNNPMRPELIYLVYRNMVWLGVKNFSFTNILLLAMRDLLAVIYAPIKFKTLKVIPNVIGGYLNGWLNIYKILKKRKPVKKNIQDRFIKSYVFGKN